MSPEFTDGDDVFVPVECRDEEGRELFPTELLGKAQSLPRLLRGELDDPEKVMGDVDQMVRGIAGTISVKDQCREVLLRTDDSGRVKTIQKQMQKNICLSGKAQYVRNNSDATTFCSTPALDRALAELVPNEFGLIDELINSRKSVEVSEFIQEARLQNGATHFIGETQEGIDILNSNDLLEAVDALALLKAGYLTHELQTICLSYGNRSQREAAAKSMGRFYGVMRDTNIQPNNKMFVVNFRESFNLAKFTCKGLKSKQLREDLNLYLGAVGEEVAYSRRVATVFRAAVRARRMVAGYDSCEGSEELIVALIGRDTLKTMGANLSGLTGEELESSDNLPEYTARLREIVSSPSPKQPEMLSTKEIKRRGLDEARAVLVKGESDKDGNIVVPGRSKSDAQMYISNLEFLRGFIKNYGGDIAEAKDGLEQAILDTDEFLRSISSLMLEASGQLDAKRLSELRKGVPDVVSLRQLVDDIKNDWDAASFVIREYWPDSGRSAEDLRQLLFLSKEEIESTAEEIEVETIEDNEPVELVIDEQIEVNPLEARADLDSIAKQLDEIVLPPRATQSDVKRIVEESGLSYAEAAQIDWDRLHNLVKLREENDGTLYRSKPGDLGNAPPYFVVVMEFGGTTYVVAESPVEGNATYVLSERLCPGTWLEVLQLDKASAREVGARRVIHREGKTTSDHLTKIQDVLIDLVTVEA